MAIVIIGVLIAGLVWYFNRPGDAPVLHKSDLEKAKVRDAAKVEPPVVKWTDVTPDAGIAFVHVNGAYGQKLLPETMGGGVAFLDFDNDGDQDLLLVNGCNWPWHPGDASAARPTMARFCATAAAT